MHAKANVKQLAAALKLAGKAIQGRPQIPVLSHFHLSVESDSRVLTIRATDLAKYITVTVPLIEGSEAQGGAITVPHDKLREFVASLDGGEVEMIDNPKLVSLAVQQGKAKANIKGIDPQEFPAARAESIDCKYAVNSDELRRMIGETVFAAADNDARLILACVLLTIKGDVLTLAATDGFRLAESTCKLTEAASEDIKLLIPAGSIAMLPELATGETVCFVPFSVDRDYRQIKFESGGNVLVAQLEEDTYPDYKVIIPKHVTITAVAPADALRRACRQVEIFAKDNAYSAQFSFAPPTLTDPASITIIGHDAETGDGESVVDCSECNEPIQIGLNIRFFRDVLAVVEGNVRIEMTKPTAPALIRPADRDDFLYIIMPIRIGK